MPRACRLGIENCEDTCKIDKFGTTFQKNPKIIDFF